jgi:hypothetical protein
MESIELLWQGPFPLFNPNNAETVALLPEYEGKPGIYLWCSRFGEEYHVIYVGQSKYLANRFREHIRNQLCGASVILDSEALESQGKVERIYSPDDVKWMIEYLKDFHRLSMHAYRNLTMYSIFLAVVEPTNIGNLKLIESGIINALLNQEVTKRYLLNTGLSKLGDPKNPIQILSNFDHRNVVVGVSPKINY